MQFKKIISLLPLFVGVIGYLVLTYKEKQIKLTEGIKLSPEYTFPLKIGLLIFTLFYGVFIIFIFSPRINAFIKKRIEKR